MEDTTFFLSIINNFLIEYKEKKRNETRKKRKCRYLIREFGDPEGSESLEEVRGWVPGERKGAYTSI